MTHRVFQVEKLIARSSFNLIPDRVFLLPMQNAIILLLFISYAFNQLVVVYGM